MKKRTIKKGQAVVGSVLLASTILSGCVAVYGPPKESDTPPRRTARPDTNYGEDVYGPPLIDETPAPTVSFDPDENMPIAVYGPPSYFGLDDPDEDFDPDENIPAPVYGPAPWYEDEPVETPEP